MLSSNIYKEESVPTQFERFWTHYRDNSSAMFAFWCLIVIIIVTLFAPWLVPYDPQWQSDYLLMPPSWNLKGEVMFFLGTDDLGRDFLSRLLIGSKFTFGYAAITALLSGLIGCFIGICAGMTKGVLSSVLNHLLDIILFIPSLVLAIIFLAFLGFGENTILLSIWLSLIPRFSRAIYTAIHNELEKDYILAARLDGANDFYLLWNSILPNILTTIVNELTFAISVAILNIAALGFLGLGFQAPSTEWGAILSNSVELIYLAPWTITLPGMAITFTIIIINIVGDGVKQALNSGIE